MEDDVMSFDSRLTNEEETIKKNSGGYSDSVITTECKQVVHSMETEVISFKRPVEKRKVPEEDNDDGFVTVTKRKTKRLLKSNSPGPEAKNNEYPTNSEDNNEICVTSLCALPTQMAMARLMKSENIEGITKIKYKSPFKILIQFATQDAAEKLLNCKKFEDLDYRCQKTYDKNVTYGMVRGVDILMDEKEIMGVLECECKILTVKRLKRVSNEGTWIFSETIRICFESLNLPKYVVAYGCRMTVEPFVFPVTRCSGCWKFSHIIKFCPTKRPLCPKCGNSSHSNCDIAELKCLNCKGPHFVLNPVCPLFLKEKEIRKIMSQENVTYKKALQIRNNMNRPRNQDDDENVIEEFEETEDTNQTHMTQGDSSRSYRNVLISATVHRHLDNSMNDEETEELLTERSRENLPMKKKTPKTKQKQREKDRDKEREKPSDETERRAFTEKEDRKVDFMELLQKIRIIIFAKDSLENKIMNVCSLIFKECKIYLLNIFSGANLFEGLVGFFCNNING